MSRRKYSDCAWVEFELSEREVVRLGSGPQTLCTEADIPTATLVVNEAAAAKE